MTGNGTVTASELNWSYGKTTDPNDGSETTNKDVREGRDPGFGRVQAKILRLDESQYSMWLADPAGDSPQKNEEGFIPVGVRSNYGTAKDFLNALYSAIRRTSQEADRRGKLPSRREILYFAADQYDRMMRSNGEDSKSGFSVEDI